MFRLLAEGILVEEVAHLPVHIVVSHGDLCDAACKLLHHEYHRNIHPQWHHPPTNPDVLEADIEPKSTAYDD